MTKAGEFYISNPLDATVESLKLLAKYDLKILLKLLGLSLLVGLGLTVTFAMTVFSIISDSAPTAVELITVIVSGLGLAALTLVVTVAEIKIFTDAMARKKSNLKELLTVGIKKMFPFLGLNILYGLMIIGGLILLVVPGIYLAIRFSMAQYILIADGVGVIESLRRSFTLSKNHMWELAGGFSVPGIFSNLGQFIVMWGLFNIVLSSTPQVTIYSLAIGFILFVIVSMLAGIANYSVIAFRHHQLKLLQKEEIAFQKTHNLNFAATILFVFLSIILPSPTEKPYMQKIADKYPEIQGYVNQLP